jgi:hypothetical protein
MGVTNPYSVSRVYHAVVEHAAPDFSHLPEGRLFANDQSDWTDVTDVARGIQMVPTADIPPLRRYNIQRPGSGVP